MELSWTKDNGCRGRTMEILRKDNGFEEGQWKDGRTMEGQWKDNGRTMMDDDNDGRRQ